MYNTVQMVNVDMRMVTQTLESRCVYNSQVYTGRAGPAPGNLGGRLVSFALCGLRPRFSPSTVDRFSPNPVPRDIIRSDQIR